MSIYSGFSNRKIEQKYNILIKQLLSLMNQIIITMVKTTNLINFKTSFLKIENQIYKLDQIKFNQPKFSNCLTPLTELFKQLEQTKEWKSEPESYSISKKEKRSGGVKEQSGKSTKRSSIDIHQTRKTLSFSEHLTTQNTHKSTTNNNQLNNNKKPNNQHYTSNNQRNRPPVYKQNRYIFQQITLDEQIPFGNLHEKPDTFRSKKIYRSNRQSSHHLISARNSQLFNNLQSQLTMEELMVRNPLVERKMSAQKKRRKLIRWDFTPQIRQEDNQGDEGNGQFIIKEEDEVDYEGENNAVSTTNQNQPFHEEHEYLNNNNNN